ncbi:hypothetical protein Y032_0091g2418 [Ancylostoma ceylanicum]|uniref:Uncharacterized protein n=1 Tax=Ancylostoma ceylanicum TaxID=53326 RepID=A0A016TM05_9BILA|nr:hypothetical protein Y032_0091g2418 [Ancylostoma ceylanicum]
MPFSVAKVTVKSPGVQGGDHTGYSVKLEKWYRAPYVLPGIWTTSFYIPQNIKIPKGCGVTLQSGESYILIGYKHEHYVVRGTKALREDENKWLNNLK